MSTGLDFVVIGAQKGGSTLLARGLGQHPQIWMPADEIPVFRDPLYSRSRVSAFTASLLEHSVECVRGIKCPDYLARPEVPPRLLELDCRPKLVLCLRDPVARAISTYFWQVRWGLLPIEDPAGGLIKVLDGSYRSINPTVDDILGWGLYGMHVNRYLQFFERREMHVLLNDELRSMPKDAFAGVFRFLGVEPDYDPPAIERRINEGVYSMRRLRFLALRNRYILNWTPERTYATIYPATGMVPRVVSKTVAAVDKVVLSRVYGNEMPKISSDVISRLRSFYLADITLLETILERDLRAWKG